MNYSLKRRLLITLVSASMVIWGITAYLSYRVTRDEVANLFDAELAQSAKVLHAFIESLVREGSLSGNWNKEQASGLLHTQALRHKFKSKSTFQLWAESGGLLLESDSSPIFLLPNFDGSKSDSQLWAEFDEMLQAESLGHKYERKIAFQLWSKKDGLLLRSESAPKFALSAITHGFSENNIDGNDWHVFSLTDSTGEYVIHVGQKEQIRSELTDEISSQLFVPFLVGLPLLWLVISFIVRRALRPFHHLEKALAIREANYLKPLPLKRLPKEIVPMVNEINKLFAQLEEAFEHERRFTADASHELRTPLAGLLTQAHVALRTDDDDVRKQALLRIKQAVNRMTYLVQQLLTFSRIESNTEFLTKQNTMINREVVVVITDLEPNAHKKQITIELVEDNPVPVMVNAPLVSILIRNIIDNAIKYTPVNGNVLITVTGRDRQLELCVEDSGPGIAPDQYEKSLERFHRCVETSNKTQGTGLGFSMVQRIASLHNADLILGVSQFGGLKVKVLFPLPMKLMNKKPATLRDLFKVKK